MTDRPTPEQQLAPVDVAKAALCEAGRPDLAARVNPNRAGWPSMRHGSADRDVIVRAFWLAHRSAGHDCRIGRGLDMNFEWAPAIVCEDCEHSSEDMR